MAVLVMGWPGVGKTTLIERVVAQLPAPVGGFYTHELREGRTRVGFELVTLDGQRGVLAHVSQRRGPRVGKYGVDLRVMEELGVPALQRAAAAGGYVVVDEIGRMELLSAGFVSAMWELLQGPHRLLGTIMSRPHPVADEFKRLPGVHVIEVTAANRGRQALVDRILTLLGVKPG